MRRLSWSISNNFGTNSLFKCVSQPEIAKNSLKPIFRGLKVVQGHRCWYPRKGRPEYYDNHLFHSLQSSGNWNTSRVCSSHARHLPFSGCRLTGRRGTACILGQAEVNRPVAAAVWFQRVFSSPSLTYVNIPSTYVDFSFCTWWKYAITSAIIYRYSFIYWSRYGWQSQLLTASNQSDLVSGEIASFLISRWQQQPQLHVLGGRNFGFPIDRAHRLYNSLLLPHIIIIIIRHAPSVRSSACCQ